MQTRSPGTPSTHRQMAHDRRQIERVGPIAMRKANPVAGDLNDGVPRKTPVAEAVMIPTDRNDRRQSVKIVEHARHRKVSRVENDIAAFKRFEDSFWHHVEILTDMRIGHEPDPRGHAHDA
jgi:hypothetical protein